MEESKIVMKYDTEYKSSCKFSPSKTDYVIKKDFFMAVVNYDMLTEFSIPSIYFYLSNKKHWIKKDSTFPNK